MINKRGVVLNSVGV